MSPGSLLAASFNTPVIKYRQVGITVTAPETGQSVAKTSIYPFLVVEQTLRRAERGDCGNYRGGSAHQLLLFLRQLAT